MTLEIMRRGQHHIYRISEADPRIIERRLNKARARWKMWRLCADADAARAALLTLTDSKISHANQKGDGA